jgi:fatty acid desaturase
MAERIKFYKTAVDKEKLRELTKRRDLPGLMQSLSLLFIYLITTVVSVYFFNMKMWIPMIAACYLHAMFSGFLGMSSTIHELSHKTPFKTKALNEFFYYLFAFISWNNPIHFRESHTRHHHLTVFKGRDKEVVLTPAPFGFVDFLSWFIFDYKKFHLIMRGHLSYFFGKDMPDTFFWDPLFENKDDPKRKAMFKWSRIEIIGHLLFVALFIMTGQWVLIFTFTCSYFFADFLNRACEMTQHVGMASDIPDWRITCHTMVFGPVISYFYWNMNYHIEHHMFAAVPFYNLKKLHDLIAHDTPEPVKGYFGGIAQIKDLMKKQRNDPDWCFIPVLPETASPAKMTE